MIADFPASENVAPSIAGGRFSISDTSQRIEHRLLDANMARSAGDRLRAFRGFSPRELKPEFPGVGDGDFPCEMLGRRYSGTLRTRPTPNPNFRRVDAIVRDEAQRPLVTVSAIVTRL